MERWQFIESPNGAWYWLCSDVISHRTRTSAATFATRTECVADATASGYQNNSFGCAGAAPRHAQGRRRYKGIKPRMERFA
jgi:hypothetical protein